MAESIAVVDYDPGWPSQFAELRARIAAALGSLAQQIEHVGSTSVEGLASKPIIDLDAVISSNADLPAVIERLLTIGYRHEGDRGIPGREAFASEAGPAHHLYVCAVSSQELARHIAFRDLLRSQPETARAYAALKRELAQQFGADRDAYTEGKSEFIERVLSE